MRPSSVRFSMMLASACSGFLLSAGLSRTGQAATYVVPAGFVSAYSWPAYYPTIYYPSAYYAAPALVQPTAYYVPSTYTYRVVPSTWSLPAASLRSTEYTVDYAPSDYYAPAGFTRYYATSGYVPTYAVYPTVLDSCCVPAPVCCDVVAAPAIRVAEPPPAANVIRQAIPPDRAPQGEPSGPGSGRKPIPLDRDSQEGGTISSRVKSPPEAPAAERAQPSGRNEKPETKKASPEPGPARDNNELEPAPPLDPAPARRDSMRPTYPSQPAGSLVQAVLRGRVESNVGDVREGVRVTAASRNAFGVAHSGISDAFGGFAIRSRTETGLSV